MNFYACFAHIVYISVLSDARSRFMNTFKFICYLVLICSVLSCNKPGSNLSYKISISIPDSLAKEVKYGRVILMFSKHKDKEPQFEITNGTETQIAFGNNVENWQKGHFISFNETEFGFPIHKLSDIPPG